MEKNCIIPYLIVVVVAINLQACTAVQQLVPGTPTFTPTITSTHTPIPTPTITPTSTITPSPTITPNLIATQQYESFLELVQQFYEQKYIPSTKGTYQRLDDYSASFAKAEYYQWESVVLSAKYFIIRTGLVMETVNQTFPRGGCGFIIHGNDMLMLSQKGNVYRFDPIFGVGPTNYLGESFNPWKVELTLIYNGSDAWLFVDGKEKLKANINAVWQNSEDVAFAVISGSNDDFGTRCEFTNTDFWTIEE